MYTTFFIPIEGDMPSARDAFGDHGFVVRFCEATGDWQLLMVTS